MRKMKDSGIEWIGEIPESWESLYAFQCFYQVKNKNEGLAETNLLSLSYGKLKRKSMDTSEGLLPESFETYNIIEADDIVLRLTDLQNDHTSLRVGLSGEKGIITSAYITLRNYSKSIPKYLYYYLHSFDIAKGFYGMGAGVRQGLNWDGLKHLQILAPTSEEQLAISAYLDRQCALIDSVTEKTKASIEEYKKLRQAVITQAVTKGVRGDRPMKDSGIEWIGEIPEEWKVAKTKIIADRIVVGVVIKPADYFDEAGTVPFLRGINIKEYSIVSEPMVYITKESNLTNSKSIIHTGDILIVRDGSIGVSCVVPSEYDGANVVSLIIVTCAKNNNPYFFAYSLNSGVGKVQFELMKIGTALTHTSVHSVSNISHTIPSIEEQNEIVQFLDKKCAEIDALITKKETFLTELEAYKKTLIYEYVTGKKEVPQA